LIWIGKLAAIFNPMEKIESLDFHTAEHHQYVSRNSLKEHFKPVPKQSPRLPKKVAGRAPQKQAEPDDYLMNAKDLPSAPIVPWGVTVPILKYLEISETLSNMQELMIYAQQNPGMGPAQALEALVASYPARDQAGFAGAPPQPGQPGHPMQQRPPMNIAPNQNPAMQQQHQQQQQQQQPGPQQGQMNGPQAARTPGGGPYMAGPYAASPHMANLGLPNAMNGSPHMGTPMGLPGGSVGAHTPSPATSHMGAPGMVSQHSQQGTPIATGTAGASPNISNKRRRSTVKAEDDGADVNGVGAARVKASPRVPSNKKLKGAPS
jgi:hypothetical protein